MGDRCTIRVDDRSLPAEPGESLAVTLLREGCLRFGESRGGRERAPLCGMGTCYECLVQVDGHWARACLEPARDGLEVRTRD